MIDFRRGTARVSGLDVSFLEAGEGPLVLCLHGFPDHARSFRHQLPALAAAGFRAVAPFLRGYAPTGPAPDGRYQTAHLALDAVALVDALGYSSAHVFGHDWGAIAAYGAAIAAPTKITRLVTAAVPYGPSLMQAFLTNYDQQRRSWYMFFFQHPLAEAAVAHDDFRFLERLWQDWSPGWRYEPEEMKALKETFGRPGVVEAALAYYRWALNPPDPAPELADLQMQFGNVPVEVPTLMLHGARDGCIGAELLAGMDAFFPRGLDTVVIPEAGHFVHQEKPEIVNPLVVKFLTAHLSRTGGIHA